MSARHYTVDLRLRPDTLARLDRCAASLDTSIQGFVIVAVAEYLQRKGFAVDVPPVRRRYRDQSATLAGTSAYRNNETPKEVKPLARRTIFFPEAWRGVFVALYIRDHVNAVACVRLATVVRLRGMRIAEGSERDECGIGASLDAVREPSTTPGLVGSTAP